MTRAFPIIFTGATRHRQGFILQNLSSARQALLEKIFKYFFQALTELFILFWIISAVCLSRIALWENLSFRRFGCLSQPHLQTLIDTQGSGLPEIFSGS
jgi:hypothetical protein